MRTAISPRLATNSDRTGITTPPKVSFSYSSFTRKYLIWQSSVPTPLSKQTQPVFLMPILSIVMLILAGLLSVALTDVLAVTIMGAWPASVDATGSYFLFNVLPGSIIAGIIIGLLFGRFMRRESLAIGLIYVVTYAVAQFVLLTQLLNPLQDRLSYMSIALVVSLAVLFWRRAGREQETTPK